MKPWIENSEKLLALYKGIEGELSKHAATHSKKIKSSSAKKLDANTAVEKIHRIWRGYKVKESFVSDQYGSYVSMIDKDDERRLLSLLMFGRHAAEFRTDSNDRIANPYIHKKPYYHRVDDLSGGLLDSLQIIFGLELFETVIPVTNLSLVSLEKYLQSINATSYRIIKRKDTSISLVVIDSRELSHEDLMWSIKKSGFTASPWEISQNIKKILGADGSDKEVADKVELFIKINDHKYIKSKLGKLPKTKKELIKSDIFTKLHKVAANKDNPTALLASSMIKLIKNNDHLSEDAIKRIALILDMANIFYVSNYHRYAFCVYAIIHEISLGLATKTEKASLDESFAKFLSSSKKTLTDALSLKDKELLMVNFIASPALSGTNAFMIAKRIAATMHSTSKPLTIEMVKPYYYELKTNEFAKPWPLSSPDIYVFSTGPIVNPDGLTPGVDINKFIKDKIINPKRTKPTTIIIDTTTTNYENLHLNEDSKQLIRDGKLSIIAFESHQKFGLLHSDQAQCGRVFSFCGKGMHDEAALQQIELDAQTDFNEHLDMRIGANISSNCADILNSIKRQHFSNGSIFNNILSIADLISKDIVGHNYMLDKLSELYFIVPKSLGITNLVTERNSFGHYLTTISGVDQLVRLSANASDPIDSLILSSQIYLGLSSDQKDISINKLKDLSLAEQIITIAFISNLINPKLNSNQLSIKEKVERHFLLLPVLKACNALKGRYQYQELARYLYKLKDEIITNANNSEENPKYFQALMAALDAKVVLTDKILNDFKICPPICNFMIFAPGFIKLNDELLTDLIDHPDTLSLIIEHKIFFKGHKELFKKISALDIIFDAKSLLYLVADSQALVVLSHLIDKGFSLNKDNIKMFGDKNFASFIETNLELPLQSFIIISEMYKANIELDEETKSLIKDDPKFCQSILMIYNANNEILENLKKKDGGNKYKEALKYSPKYLQDCHLAIKEFCEVKKPTKETKDKLLTAISLANENYCDKVLSKHRNFSTSIVEKILKGLLVALSLTILLPVAPLFINNLLAHRFFKTSSQKKLGALKSKLEEEVTSIKNPLK